MFTKSLEQIFTRDAFEISFEELSSKSFGIDEISYFDFEKNLSSNIKKLQKDLLDFSYLPEPIKAIKIPKPNSTQNRPIALGSIKDKLVQKVLVSHLDEYFDKTFLSNSYAYRRGKSTITAINRTSNFIQMGYKFVLKSDIKDFFENINHTKLIQILNKNIHDKNIINLISLFLKNGKFDDYDFIAHDRGIHQGDILSPLLSNIYLNVMDKFINRKKINFIRFADDFVLFFKSKNEARAFKSILDNFLKILDLELSLEKTLITSIEEGFSFLGVYFSNNSRFIDNERFHSIIAKIESLSANNQLFTSFNEELNLYLNTLDSYYLKIILKDSSQFEIIQINFVKTIAHKIYLEKKNKRIKTKAEFINLLSQIKFDILFSGEEIKSKINLILSLAYEKYFANKYSSNLKCTLNKKRNKYIKKFSNDTTLHINEPGLSLGVSKNTFVLKRYGKIQKSFPISKIKRIIIEGKGINFSTDIILRAAKNKIAIDLINRELNPYASIINYNASCTQRISKQANSLNSPLALYLAKQFIKGKSKNQINFLKYLNKYHENLDLNILEIDKIINLIKQSKSVEQLMGYEGSIAASYWDGLRKILLVPFDGRVTFGARDLVNCSLNYAYAILYGVVQRYLVDAGLSLNISFLHALDKNKPTLSFDMIEEFRTFIVDRTIISMLNKNEPIKLGKDGLLTAPSRKLISAKIKEKLSSYTTWKKSSIKCENIIKFQCYSLAKAIDDNKPSYKPFLGKY